MNVPYVDLALQHSFLKQKLLSAVGSVLDHGQFILGPEVLEFERRFADLCGVSHSVGLNSGTDALVLALKALGIGDGDEVITVPGSFVASTSCIALVGATPVFVDVGDDYNIDSALIEQSITSRTKAILLVHLTGRPADMDPILEIAKKYGIRVIEDAAQAVCAEYKGRRVGSFGDVGCFSLHPLKTLNACGDGGALTTNDSQLANDVRILRNIGLKDRDNCVVWGHNSRLDTLQAAILLAKLDCVEEWTERRRANANMYRQLLKDIPSVTCPLEEKSYEKSVYHTFVIQVERREELRAYMSASGVGTSVHYPVPIHLQEAAGGLGYGFGSFPVTERQASRILSLPVYPELNSDQLEYVSDTIREFYMRSNT